MLLQYLGLGIQGLVWLGFRFLQAYSCYVEIGERYMHVRLTPLWPGLHDAR